MASDGTTRLQFAEHLTPLARGVGHGQLEILNALSMQQVKDERVEVGDTVLLDDRENWPAGVQGFKVGKIVSIQPQTKSPLSAQVRIEPEVDFLRLTDVVVLRHD